MAISSFFHQWYSLFLPYQKLSFYRSCLDFFTELIFYKNVSASRKVYILYLLHLVFILQNVYLWFYLPPHMDRLRQGDFISTVLHTDALYLVHATLGLMVLYFIHILCFTMKASFYRLLEDILFRDTHGTLTGVAYGKYTEQTTARIIILGHANLLQVFILVIGKFRLLPKLI